jgi:flagellar basal-body rod protein FlgB
MPMIDRLDAELAPQRKLLAMRGFRQELLASNIANADTPNYKARDIDFASVYSKAMQGAPGASTQAGMSMSKTNGAHFAGSPASPFDNAVAYRTEHQSSVDGNTVNMDIERAAFAENAIQMEATLTFLRSRFQTLQSAVQSQ